MLAYANVWHEAYSDNSDIATFYFAFGADWHFHFEDDYERVGRLTTTGA